MKSHSNQRQNSNGQISRYYSKAFWLMADYKLTTRTTALLLVLAMISPIILLKPTQSVSAGSDLPAVQTTAAPVSAPPEPFVLSSTTNPILSATLSSAASFGTLVSNGYSSCISFFTIPQIPAEFAGAKGVSPFSTYLSSFSSSIASSVTSSVSSLSSFLGFAKPAAPVAMLLPQSSGTAFDFDHDGKADIARYHRASGEWKVRQSSNGTYLTVALGSASSVITPADYDGDGVTDFAVFNPGTVANASTWTIKTSASATANSPITFGSPGDKPLVGYFDADTVLDLAVFRPSNSTWYIRNSNSNYSITSAQFGSPGDVPVADDYDGDGKTDIAVFRPTGGYWYVQGSSTGFSSLQWGNASDIPVPADYDGDGKTDRAVYRGSTGQWFIYKSLGGGLILTSWGNYGDQPVPADYDGDGKADIAVFRPTNTIWYITRSQNAGYDAWNLGVSDDAAVPAAYLKQVGGEVYSYDFAKTRLSPKNATGGTNLYSRNFSWGTGLVGLPGRAGLDAGFGVSYNSLIWTKQDSAMVFDADKSQAGPGFRFGYPTIEPVYYNGSTFNYLMITPSGARVEFRQQQGASNIYETADSSYTQLKVNGSGNPNDAAETLPLTLTGTDGTQMSYVYLAGAYRCAGIKDANGNFITIANDEYGLLRTVTDTLGRVITVAYDGDFNPTTITQVRKDNNGQGGNVTHTYATFNYAASPLINPNFGSSITTVYGPQGVNIKVLQSIAFADGSSTRFDYNKFGQVYKVSNYASDNHELNHTQVNLSSADLSAAQSDCPRFSQTQNFAEKFNGNQDTVTTNSYEENKTLPGVNEPVTLVTLTTPDGVVEHSYSLGRTDWTEALPLYSETCTTSTCAGADKKRWIWNAWTQDAPTAPYLLNPRRTSTTVSDSVSSRRTEISYYPQPQNSSVALYGLVKEVRSYDANQNALLKKSLTEYNLDNAYVSRRIIGLPSKTTLKDGSEVLMSEISYAYDEGSFTADATLNQNLSSAIQHDNTNYGASFTVGRGNLTSTTRSDVLGQTASVTSSVKYNTTGAAVAQITPGSDPAYPTRTVKIDYADEFNDAANAPNRNTFAYPTTLTDPDGFSSVVKYRYDIGANVEAKSPNLDASTLGKKTTREFDAVGRLLKQTLVNTGAYTRYDYTQSDRDVHLRTYSTVVDTTGDGANAADEVLSESWTDGAGRVIKTRTPLRFNAGGSASAWTGAFTEYDVSGQVKRRTVPTEVNSSWQPAGDDYRLDANGNPAFLWTSSEYDWKGRVTKEINTDNTEKSISYDGCGCAGGQITTVQEELVPRDDEPTSNARRTQKIYADVQGRTVKTEVMNWNGTTPYMTTVNTYNGRDQVTSSVQYAGAAGGTSPHQDATMEYDGHGRLKRQHRPEQNSNTATIYNYNADDSISSIVDARGASTNYKYNRRALVTEISYEPNDVNIQDAPTVAFTYDNMGNRKRMDDGLGHVDYEYNQLSQMTAETRHFSDTLTGAPLADNAFKLEYDYALSGQLKSLKDPFGQQFNYAYDKVGRLDSVTGSTAFNGISTYASNPRYNARGTLTGLDYGNGVQMAITGFNNKLQATDFEVKKGAASIIKKQYQFYADGSLKFTKDLIDEKFDRLYKYDNLGRTTEAKSGIEARGGTDANLINIPYKFQYQYSAFGQMTQVSGRYYNSDSSNNYTFDNGTGRNPQWTYDAEGNTTADNDAQYKFDALNRVVKTTESETGEATDSIFDGAGELIKRVKDAASTTPQSNYYIRSSVLTKVISETDATGKKLKTFVSANGATLAEQELVTVNGTTTEHLNFIHQDPSGSSVQQTTASGALTNPYNRTGEYDALGRNVADASPYITLNSEPPNESNGSGIDLFGSAEGFHGGQNTYRMDGMPVSQSQFMLEVNSGRVGGAFGLLFASARMSMGNYLGSTYGYRDRSGREWRNLDRDTAFTFQRESHGQVNVNNYYSVTAATDFTWSIVASLVPLAQQQNQAQVKGEKVALSGDRLKKYNEKRDIIKNKLQKSKKCRDFLISIGIDPELALQTVNEQSAFDGEKSTLSRIDAGVVNPEVDLTTQQGRDYAYKPINLSFTNSTGPKIQAWTSFYSSNERIFQIAPEGRNEVYYRGSGINTGNILHEALHSLTGLGDEQLAGKIGVSVTKDDTQAISNKLKDMDCGD